MVAAAGSIRWAGITLPGNTVRSAGFEFEAGSYIVVPVALKLPPRISAVGMVKNFGGEPCRTVVRSQSTKKKSLFLPLNTFGIQTGPPKATPNWLRMNLLFCGVGWKKFWAKKWLSVLNIHPAP